MATVAGFRTASAPLASAWERGGAQQRLIRRDAWSDRGLRNIAGLVEIPFRRGHDRVSATRSSSRKAARKVIAIDLPGHGATPAEADSGTFDGLVGSVERYIASAGLAGLDVVGSSMGARIVLELARRGVVGNVVALDPGGFWRGWERTFFRITIGASGRLLRAIRSSLPALSRNAESRTALLAQLSARPWALDGQMVATELEGLSMTPTFDALVHNLAAGPEQTGPAAAITGRIVIGWGRHDRLCLPRQAARAQAAFPAAKLHWFQDSGHFPMWDAPTDTAAVILDATQQRPTCRRLELTRNGS